MNRSPRPLQVHDQQLDATPDQPSDQSSNQSQTLLKQLTAFRQCLIHLLLAITVVFIALLPFAKEIYTVFATPLLEKLPTNSQMIATDLTTTFIAPVKLSLFLALLICLPFLLFRIWRFIAPALYFKEKKLILPLFIFSLVLFYLGISFATWVVLPSVLYFFIHATPEAVLPMTDISSYLSFCLTLFFTFGLSFEIPVIIVLLVASKIISIDQLIEKRKFIIVGCFFIAMFITPPDIFSMLFLAIPMTLLFELGILFSKIINKPIKAVH